MIYHRNIDCITSCFFLLFQSDDKTSQECAEWCDSTRYCKGFAVVDPRVRPGIHRCYLKRALTYPPTLPDERATFIYYRLTSEFQGEQSPQTTIPQTTIPPTTTLGKFTITAPMNKNPCNNLKNYCQVNTDGDCKTWCSKYNNCGGFTLYFNTC